MKLHWIEIESWKKLKRIKIEFDKRATVIYGDNEAGKSTVFDALSKGLFRNSESNAKDVKKLNLVRPAWTKRY